MESAPPSYEKATLIDHWDLIARFVPSNDLCSAALVCNRWHNTFAPHLWGNPASHFGIENDRVYVALTKFKRTLKTARLLVRSQTHTLHLPPAHAEIYNGPHADWLRDILDRLPHLQTLIVRGLPFFDYSALQALRYVKPKTHDYQVPESVIELPGSSGYAFESAASANTSFGLRLLDASRCSNVTAAGLVQGLDRFEALMYLDLSFTYPARDTNVLYALRKLSGLQVLKLRGVSLTDAALDALAPSIGLRVRSLDIRDNRITDRGVRTLLDHCFAGGEAGPAGARSPALLPYLGAEMLDIYQGENLEGYLRSVFTGNFVSRLAIEDVPESGITHLYIAGNNVTAEGASGLLRSGRLHVFDLASVESGFARLPSFSGQSDDGSEIAVPGVEKLTPVLAKCASDVLTFLRVDHSLITRDVPNLRPEEVVQGRVELGDTSLPPLPADAAEMDATSTRPEAFELPTVQTPRHELPGDPMQFVLSPAINDLPHVDTDENEEPCSARRGSAFAPEVIENLSAEVDGATLLSPISALGEGTMNGTLSCSNPVSPVGTPTASAFVLPERNRPRSYSSVATERRAKLTAHTNGNHNLHPAMLPHLSTLVLTNVPQFASSHEEVDRLIHFIKQCAEEAALARAQAKLDYALPPGRKGHASALRHSTNSIFGLRRIVLELAQDKKLRKSTKASPWQHMETKSLTEDRDSEALWSAAETDFSFFGEGDECDFPSLERGRFAHSSNEKEVSFSNGFDVQRRAAMKTQAAEPKIDTVAILSAFRKERKLAHQRAMAAGAEDLETEGFWDGVVQVVRPANGLRPDEELDYYGNTYSGGYLYR